MYMVYILKMNSVESISIMFPYGPMLISRIDDKTCVIVRSPHVNMPQSSIQNIFSEVFKKAATYGHIQSYCYATTLCNNIKPMCNVISCNVLTLNVGFNQITHPRNYTVYEELYLGRISHHILPLHYIVHVEIIIDETIYNMAIDPLIKTPSGIQIFVDDTYIGLTRTISNRYLPKSITLL